MQSSFFHVSHSEYLLDTLSEATGGQGNHSKESDMAHFPAITQGEHPQTGLPCFYLHPCETSAALRDVLSDTQEDRNGPLQFIESWFMLVSTLVDVR